MTAPTETPVSQRSHLQAYLDYYRSLKEPRYAILVTGDWGTGKTYQVRAAIPRDEAYYISLFGLNSADDVIAAVYTAMFPAKSLVKKLANGISETTAEIPGLGSLALNGLTSGLVGAFLRQEVNKDKPIIFDDLERCGLSVKEALGIINLYVEHHGCCVIVIAHDQKMTEGFAEAKEKIFGQTIRVEPQVQAAFDDFHSTLASGPAKDCIAKQRETIIGVFTESGVKSLRILRHLVEDLARLLGALTDKQRSHDHAMVELVRLFSAFDIEWRANRLQDDDLFRRSEKEMAYGIARHSEARKDQFPPPIVTSRERYSSVNLTNTLLQDNILHQLLVEGRFDEASIQESLDASSYFLKPQSAPPWQVVCSFDKLEDDIVGAAAERMQQQFERREIVDSGEMLHVFALRMMMVSKGILRTPIKDIASECKAYIDDLLREGRLAPRDLNWRWYEDFRDAAYGVGYWVTEDYKADFDQVFQHLLAARSSVLEAEFPTRAREILDALEADGQRFLELVCDTRVSKTNYAMIPILAAIEPKDFVAAWMRSPKENWYWISNALRERYKTGRLGNDLKGEAGWIEQVVKFLHEEADKASGFAKVRIQRSIPKIDVAE